MTMNNPDAVMAKVLSLASAMATVSSESWMHVAGLASRARKAGINESAFYKALTSAVEHGHLTLTPEDAGWPYQKFQLTGEMPAVDDVETPAITVILDAKAVEALSRYRQAQLAFEAVGHGTDEGADLFLASERAAEEFGRQVAALALATKSTHVSEKLVVDLGKRPGMAIED